MPATGKTILPELMARLKGALASKDRAETRRVVAEMLDHRAPLGEHWRAIAQLMQTSGELTLALRAIDAFVAATGNNPMAVYSKVVLLTQAHRVREAHDLLAHLPATVPDAAGHAYVLGNTAMTLGNVDAARAHLLDALTHRPGWGPAWLTLAAATNLADGPIGDRLLAEGAAAERQGAGDFARYSYALGKLHADRGEHGAAFAAFVRGAALLKAEVPYNCHADAANAADAMEGFDGARLDRKADPGAIVTGRPIFVTGLPRSGTTLVEQILASHSAVQDGGELNMIQHVVVAAGGVSGTAIEQHLARGGTLNGLAELYLHLLQERFGPSGRIVDKTIDASRFLGLIATVLPDAPLVWMRRDPLDTAWSCFRTFFIHGVGWSFDLADIANHFRLEDALMAFWKQRLGDRLLVIPYGELVEDPSTWTARLLAHCGLADEPAVYEPHLNPRRVVTASALQVRRPINRDGLGVAEPYRAWLQPFIDGYAKP